MTTTTTTTSLPPYSHALLEPVDEGGAPSPDTTLSQASSFTTPRLSDVKAAFDNLPMDARYGVRHVFPLDPASLYIPKGGHIQGVVHFEDDGTGHEVFVFSVSGAYKKAKPEEGIAARAQEGALIVVRRQFGSNAADAEIFSIPTPGSYHPGGMQGRIVNGRPIFSVALEGDRWELFDKGPNEARVLVFDVSQLIPDGPNEPIFTLPITQLSANLAEEEVARVSQSAWTVTDEGKVLLFVGGDWYGSYGWFFELSNDAFDTSTESRLVNRFKERGESPEEWSEEWGRSDSMSLLRDQAGNLFALRTGLGPGERGISEYFDNSIALFEVDKTSTVDPDKAKYDFHHYDTRDSDTSLDFDQLDVALRYGSTAQVDSRGRLVYYATNRGEHVLSQKDYIGRFFDNPISELVVTIFSSAE